MAGATEAERLVEYDARLGWANIKNRRALDRYGPGRNATHNPGLRAIHEYDVGVLAGRYRIVFLGDSYTYGVDTGDMSNFVAQIEALAPRSRLNMYVPGYGVDQMLCTPENGPGSPQISWCWRSSRMTCGG
jgi:hypothetical protein